MYSITPEAYPVRYVQGVCNGLVMINMFLREALTWLIVVIGMSV